MSKITCIVIEDEPLATRVLTDYIGQVPFLELHGTFKNALLATEYLRDHTPDLIFLDIHLPKLKGMTFLKTLSHPPAIIITTAYHQYAVEGFDLNVTDYLLKPFGFDRFLVAVGKVKTNRSNVQSTAGSPEQKDYVFLHVQKKKVKISFAEIMYIESQREYIRIVTTEKEFMVKMSTHEMESLLPANRFRRVHRSFIVSLDKVASYTAEVIEVKGASIPIGREYKGVTDDL